MNNSIHYTYRASGLYEFNIGAVGFKVEKLEAEFDDRAGRWMLTMGEGGLMEWVGEYDTKREAMEVAAALTGTTERSTVVYTVTTTLPDGHDISRDFLGGDEAAEDAARILEAWGSSLEAFGGTVASLTSDLNAITEGIEQDGDGYAGVVEFQYRASGATVKVAVEREQQ